jgi:transposase
MAQGRMRRIMLVALARKLMVALWRFLSEGLVPDGAALKA